MTTFHRNQINKNIFLKGVCHEIDEIQQKIDVREEYFKK